MSSKIYSLLDNFWQNIFKNSLPDSVWQNIKKFLCRTCLEQNIFSTEQFLTKY